MKSLATYIRTMPSARLAVLLLSFFLGLMLTSAFMVLEGKMTGISQHSKLLFTSAAQCIFAFIIPSFVLARFCSNRPFQFLGLELNDIGKCGRLNLLLSIAGVCLIYFFSLPAMEWIVTWNSNMHFPAWASSVESIMREWEDTNASVSMRILTMDSFGAFLATVAVVGLLTAFAEELFFRGALQTLLYRDNGGGWKAVWLSALIFSAIHFQFFGFAPRLLIGAFLGYVFFWTKSIWPSVTGHALNNSMVVAISYFTGDIADNSLENLGLNESGMTYSIFASIVATVILLFVFRKFFFRSIVGNNCHG